MSQAHLVNSTQASQLKFCFLKEPLPILECLQERIDHENVTPTYLYHILKKIVTREGIELDFIKNKFLFARMCVYDESLKGVQCQDFLFKM